MKKTEPKSDKQWSPYSLALNIGYMIVTPILVFGIGGVLLDRYLSVFPIFTFIGFFLAMTSGLVIVYKKSKDMIEGINSQTTPKK
jgi:F0F1-type ATP synthase assembly protein I